MPFSPASSCFLPTQVHGAQPPPRARLGCSTGCTPAAAPATIAVAEGPSHERGWGRGWGVWSSPVLPGGAAGPGVLDPQCATSTPSSGSRTCCTGCTPAAAPATRWLKASLRPGRGLDGPLGPAQGHPRSPPPPPRPPARRAAFFLPRGAPGHAHGGWGGLSGGRLGPALPPGIPRAPRTPLDFLDGPDPAPIPPAMRDLPTASFSSKAAGSRTRSKSRQLSRGRGREDGSHNHRGGGAETAFYPTSACGSLRGPPPQGSCFLLASIFSASTV